MQKFALILLLGVLFTACLETPNNFEKLPPGNWRVILKLTDPDQVSNQEDAAQTDGMIDYFKLPFNMFVEYDDEQKMKIYLQNGEERIAVEGVNYGRDPRTAKDTLQLNFSAFGTQMDAFYEDNIIEGYWNVPYKGEDYQIPFIAYYGQNHRFDFNPTETTYDFSGKWKVNFEYDNEKEYPAIGEFRQDGHVLKGTFLTETGDYRYLEGNAYGNKMKLSVFDGAHAFLFSGNVNQDTIYGEFRSGKHYKSRWMATRDEDFKLNNPYEMTKTKTNENVNFSFKSDNNVMVSLDDAEYKDKYKLINIMGTWCPNCKDEMLFLKEVKKEFPEIEIISIAFEQYRDVNKSLEVIKTYKSQLNFSWPILLGGYANKKETTESFSFLDQIYSYPTLLLVDKNNQIVDIHTGFNGPATSKYETFKNSFFAKLKNLK